MRCADRLRERGAAVILALLTVSLVAGLAAAVFNAYGRSLDTVSGLQEQAQARLLARGAVDWARNVLADDRRRTAVDHAGEAWAIQVPPTPVDEGEVGGEIVDWSGRFNLNNLWAEKEADPRSVAQYERLLGVLGVDRMRAEALVKALLARLQDARGALRESAELLALEGYDGALFERLQPLVAALPAPSTINLNSAPAEVLAALAEGLELDAARVMVTERERAWYRNVADFTGRLPSTARLPQGSAVDVRSRFFLVTGRARHGLATVRLEVLLDRQKVWPEIVWQRIP